MILLSNLIKPSFYQPLDDRKLVEFQYYEVPQQADSADSLELAELTAEQYKLNEVKAMKEQILQDAEQVAEEQIRQAIEESNQLRAQAEQEIDGWWTKRRSEDDEHVRQAKESGFRQGYEEGLAKAEAEVQANYEAMLKETRQILESAYEIKEQIIHESDPFLIQLSSAIAEKIIGHQLTLEPEWTIDLVRSILARKKEKGAITLCIAPKHFDYIYSAREELAASIDSQAELIILPDSSVRDEGCVVRSSMGSIDARIDTQLIEIKTALLHMAASDEGEHS